MPLKKSIRMKKSTHLNKSTEHSHKSTPLKKHTRVTRRIGAGAIALAVIGVTAAAMLIAGHQPYDPAAMASVDTRASMAAPQGGAKTAAPQDGAKRAAAVAPVTGAVAARTLANATAANAPAAESSTKAPDRNPAPVTITGCLERADETFRLKDTTGADAPKSRNWKSGFLKKGSASIELVDTANGLKLPDHIGQRISVTGTLIDHAMQVRSLERVAASCTDGARVRI